MLPVSMDEKRCKPELFARVVKKIEKEEKNGNVKGNLRCCDIEVAFFVEERRASEYGNRR